MTGRTYIEDSKEMPQNCADKILWILLVENLIFGINVNDRDFAYGTDLK